MSDYAVPRPPLCERLPIAMYTNLFWPVASTVWISPQAERITGYSAAEWVDNPGFFESVLHPGDREAVLEEARASRRGMRAFSADYRIIAPDGRVIWLHDEWVPVADEGGRVDLVQGYVIDITERKRLELQIGDSREGVDPMELVRRLAPVLTRVAGPFLDVDFELQSTPIVVADVRRLEHVLVSLVADARNAMPRGGVISIGTYTRGDVAVIGVVDTGLGMEEEAKVRAQAAADVIGDLGSIEFATEPGEGSRFRIFLPPVTG